MELVEVVSVFNTLALARHARIGRSLLAGTVIIQATSDNYGDYSHCLYTSETKRVEKITYAFQFKHNNKIITSSQQRR